MSKNAEDIFHDALELDATARDEFVAKACAGDAALEREVRSLLRAGEAGAAAIRSDADGPATSIGDFRIVRKIAEGGMGIVYEAEQQNPKRVVALKVTRGGRFVDDQTVRMFQREAQTLARLRHPSIGAIYESGRTDDGQHFFAMELVRGDSLDEWIRSRAERRLDGDEVRLRLQVFSQIAEAVAYAHQRGVIHRDLKPSNVLIPRATRAHESARQAPNVKVLDFGLARITDVDVAATMVTDAGLVQGSLAYMSPEQARGNPDEMDLRTDVYSLGVVLFEMLSGQLPIELSKSALHDAVRSICEEPPRPLRATGSSTRGLDRDLETIVYKALEKDPARRYQSVSAFLEDIDRYLANQPILARPPSSIYHLRKVLARNRAVFGLIVSVVLLLGETAVGMSLQARQIARERDRANEEAATARQVSEFLEELFSVSDPSEARGNSITAREILDRGVESIDVELGDQPAVRADLKSLMGNVYRKLGLYEEADGLLTESLELRRTLYSEDHPDYVENLADLGHLKYSLSKYDEARGLLERAVESQREVLGPLDPVLASTLVRLGNLYRRLREFDEAKKVIQEALDIRNEVFGDDSVEAAGAMTSLAIIHNIQKNYDEALPLFERALHIRRRELGEDHPDVAGALNNVAIARSRLGDYEGAIPLYEKSLAITEQVYGRDHAKAASKIDNLADCYLESDRDEEALELRYREAAILRRSLGPTHLNVGISMYNIASTLDSLGRYVESGDTLRAAISVLEGPLGPDHSLVNNALAQLARLYEKMGEPSRGEPLRYRVMLSSKRNLGEEHPYYFYHAACYWAWQDIEKAFTLLQQALDAGFDDIGILEDSNLRPLHGDERFAAVEREVELRNGDGE